MKKFRKARCPHCGDQLKIIQIWSIKTQGEYQCPKCGGFSNIELDFTLFHISISAIIISGLLYAGCIFFKIPLSIPLILIIMLPYFIFYILSVFLVRLKKPVVRKKPPQYCRGKNPYNSPQNMYDSARKDNNITNSAIDRSFPRKQR